MSGHIHDVIQIGYGPVGQTLALALGRQGRDVAVFERWTARYPLPRAVCIDHELYRVLCALGMEAELPAICQRGPIYQWFNAEWKTLLEIDWSIDSISGGPEINFVHQPTLEQALDRAVAAQTSVDVRLGWEAVAVSQDAELAHVTLRNRGSGAEQIVSARYVVGCDGANSIVRQAIGGGQEDHGFEADWLVIDVLLKDGVTIETLGIPAAGQYCNPVRPTTIVPAGVREGRVFRRWEFMRLPGEANEELETEAQVWELLQPWAGPEHVELIRHKVYNFRSLIAERWRGGRLLIAGDAAHVMPPFMGQGMCSGMRDAWNLAWKLGMVLDGVANADLFDSYQPERRPHVSQLVEASIYLGKIICIPDPAKAAERDHAFMTGAVEPPPPFPQLSDGILLRDGAGGLTTGAGLLSPHVEVRRGGLTGRLDDLVGPGFMLIVGPGDQTADDPLAALGADSRAALTRLGVHVVALVRDDANGTAGADVATVDLDGRIGTFMATLGWRAMVVRPDFYVYGGTGHDLPGLVRSLLGDLGRHGVGLMALAS